MTKLDYSIESPQDRTTFVSNLLSSTDPSTLTSQYLETLADYLIIASEKQERKDSRKRELLTANRTTTITKYETSFEGLAVGLENGEDGIYNLTSNRDTLLTPKISITPQDLAEIPLLRQLRDTISTWETALRKATGRDAFIIKKALIEMRKDQYLIKQAYRKPIVPHKLSNRGSFPISIDDHSTYSKGELTVAGASLLDPSFVAALLQDYSRLKQDSYDRFEGDTWYLIQALEEITDKALKEYPIHHRILEYKIDGKSNAEIRTLIKEEFDTLYTPEYISALWCKKFLVSQQMQPNVILLYGKPTSATSLLKLVLNAAALSLSLPYSSQKATQVKTSSILFAKIAAKQDMRQGVPVTVTKELYRVVTKMKGELYGTTKMY